MYIFPIITIIMFYQIFLPCKNLIMKVEVTFWNINRDTERRKCFEVLNTVSARTSQ